MTSLDEAFGPIDMGPAPAGTGASAATGAARARVEAELMQGAGNGSVQDRFNSRIAERAAMLAPVKPRASSFAEEAIGASRIVDAFRASDAEIDRVNAGIREVAKRRSAAEAALGEALGSHERLLEAAATIVHPGFDRMRALFGEFETLQKEVMLAWGTAQAVAERDLKVELEQLLDERELIREVLVAGAKELAARNRQQAQGAKDIDGVSVASGTCPVCLESPSEVAFVPCGHTVCAKCAYKLGENRSPVAASAVMLPQAEMKCPSCRRDVTSKIKLYW